MVRTLRTFWVREVKLPETFHITDAETLAVAEGEITAELLEEPFPVGGAGAAMLIEFDDVTANLPVGFGDVSVDGLGGPGLTAGVS